MRKFGKLAAVFFTVLMAAGLSAGMSLKQPDLNYSEYLEEDSEDRENLTEELTEEAGGQDTGDIREDIEEKVDEVEEDIKRKKKESVTGASTESSSGFLSAIFDIFS